MNTDEMLSVRIKTKHTAKKPQKYDVIFHNDNVTTMEAVMIILSSVFNYAPYPAYDLMMKIHTSGKGIVGTYSLDEAYKKVDEADSLKKKMHVPLVITVEEHQ